MQIKTLHGVEFKGSDNGPGTVEAVFATLNVKDHDGDVTVKGAFTDGQEVRISAYNHASWQGSAPIGKGTIHEEGENVVFRGEFFKTQAGQEMREILKGLGDLGEWSYGYDVEDSEPGEHKGESVRILKRMKVHEVSPVLLGAGVGTRTLAVKSRETMKFSEHGEAVLADLVKFGDRAAEVLAMRQEKGKGLGEESALLIETVGRELKRLHDLLTTPEPVSQSMTDEERAALAAIYLRSVAIRQGE